MERRQNKMAIITGGASGIGRACAILFAREGARVVVGGHAARFVATGAVIVIDGGITSR